VRFYFTLSPQDLCRARIAPGASLMLVASGAWRGGRLAVSRPPRAARVSSLSLDSGGFTAARRWGRYPFTPAAYACWARQTARDVPLDFVAVMDYACERDVCRDALATNAARISQTVANAVRCLEADPALPWLPVVQGYSPDDYLACARDYRERGLPLAYAGLGTVCGRPWREAAGLLDFLRRALPDTRWHVFGMDLRVLADPGARAVVRSWDSHAWNWPTGARGDACRPARAGSESYSDYCGRLARAYQRRVGRLLGLPRQGLLF